MTNFEIGVGTVTISERAKNYMNEVLETKRLSYGPFSRKFEQEFAKTHSCKFGIFMNSGTSALHIAVACLKERYNWKEEDEVIVPAITFIATSNVLIHNNLKPIFVDVEKETYNLDPKQLRQKITKKTVAIMPVHCFGLPCDMDPIREIAKEYNLRIIEDSCETMFVSYKGKSVGSLSDISCFSTYACHLITTGVGGFCLTNDPENAIILRSLANHGRDNIYISMDDDKGKTGEELKEIVTRRFNFIRLGHSFRGTEMEAALGLAQLEEHQEMIKKRKENAEKLTISLKELEEKGIIQLPKIPEDRQHAFMMFPKERIVNYLEEMDIETRDMLPLINQPIYQQRFALKEGMFPIAEWINKNGFYIGCHQDISDEELNYIIETLKDFFKNE